MDRPCRFLQQDGHALFAAGLGRACRHCRHHRAEHRQQHDDDGDGAHRRDRHVAGAGRSALARSAPIPDAGRDPRRGRRARRRRDRGGSRAGSSRRSGFRCRRPREARAATSPASCSPPGSSPSASRSRSSPARSRASILRGRLRECRSSTPCATTAEMAADPRNGRAVAGAQARAAQPHATADAHRRDARRDRLRGRRADPDRRVRQGHLHPARRGVDPFAVRPPAGRDPRLLCRGHAHSRAIPDPRPRPAARTDCRDARRHRHPCAPGFFRVAQQRAKRPRGHRRRRRAGPAKRGWGPPCG